MYEVVDRLLRFIWLKVAPPSVLYWYFLIVMLSGLSQDNVTRLRFDVAERFVGAAGRATAGVAVTLAAMPVILMPSEKLAFSDGYSAACTEKMYVVSLSSEETSAIVVVPDPGEAETS